MELKGKRIAIMLEQIYEDPEFWYPYYRFLEAGAEVVVIAPEVKEYKSKYGYPAKADKSAADADPGSFNAVIIPGGFSPDHMRRSPDMVKFLKTAYEQGKIIAAICHGPWMLASVGAVKDHEVTSFFSIKDDLVNAGGHYVDREVVRDGNIITSRTPKDLPAFCREIIDSLK
jgi:protease I